MHQGQVQANLFQRQHAANQKLGHMTTITPTQWFQYNIRGTPGHSMSVMP